MEIEKKQSEWLKSQERQENFEGWDFSSIYPEFWQENLSWSYEQIVKKYLRNEMYLLDMGTGGAELLEKFNHPYQLTSVTEGWKRNYELLLKRLIPKGVIVKFVDEDDKLDYPDNSFDIVLNSHESFDLLEVKRVLKPKGVFITQQVGDMNGINLASRLIPNFKKLEFNWHLSSVMKSLKQLDFKILEAYESYPTQKFLSMDALIYYVRTITWEFPNFDVRTHNEELEFLYQELNRVGYIYNQEHRFLIVSVNNK